MRTSLSARLGLGMLLALTGSMLVCCSLLLDFNPDGLPCDVADRQSCLEGYSCNVLSPNDYRCVADGSLERGTTCQLDRQCDNAQICPTDSKTCAPPCPTAQAYVAGSPNCGSGTYCRPSQSVGMFSDSNAHVPELVAACVPSDGCTFAGPCDSNAVKNGICADMNGANACVIGCQITFKATTYTDNCGADERGNPRFCQMLGPGMGRGVMACLEAGPTPQPVGAPCGNPVTQPCAPGSGCIRNICRAYVPPSSKLCPPGLQVCDLHVNSNVLLGYCTSDPSCST